MKRVPVPILSLQVGLRWMTCRIRRAFAVMLRVVRATLCGTLSTSLLSRAHIIHPCYLYYTAVDRARQSKRHDARVLMPVFGNARMLTRKNMIEHHDVLQISLIHCRSLASAL